jgi:hypothetical protein
MIQSRKLITLYTTKIKTETVTTKILVIFDPAHTRSHTVFLFCVVLHCQQQH